MIGLYPGSFDPITLGHEDIINRAVKICDKLVVAVSQDNQKTDFLSSEQRFNLIKSIYNNHKKIEVLTYQGLTTDFVKKIDADFIIKGLRNSGDFVAESQMAQLNKVMLTELDTIFLDSSDLYRSISSSLVKQIYHLDGDISQFVSAKTLQFLSKLK
ncbi:MAG: pantetheine-phosphate adenylyltransferase [Methylophilaceae bacterium]|jgi:pantetheine-phosphate adenylyltransferase|tara:strand:- start:382 stop:852 length:471 start_codon:yes stop_codon:yes gene_type:complete